jgi:hypothetical protein
VAQRETKHTILFLLSFDGKGQTILTKLAQVGKDETKHPKMNTTMRFVQVKVAEV